MAFLKSLNHLVFSVDDMDDLVSHLDSKASRSTIGSSVGVPNLVHVDSLSNGYDSGVNSSLTISSDEASPLCVYHNDTPTLSPIPGCHNHNEKPTSSPQHAYCDTPSLLLDQHIDSQLIPSPCSAGFLNSASNDEPIDLSISDLNSQSHSNNQDDSTPHNAAAANIPVGAGVLPHSYSNTLNTSFLPPPLPPCVNTTTPSTTPTGTPPLLQQSVAARSSGSKGCVLPPCRVCGGPSAGYHYCVESCQGCRMFFRRMLKRPITPVCLQGGGCKINHKAGRISCTGCRYQKCLQVGMKRNDKKVGRYSHAQRTAYTQELQELEIRRQLNVTSSPKLMTSSERDVELDELTAEFTNHFLNLTQNRAEVFNKLPEKEAAFVEASRLHTELFGPTQSMPDSDYHQIYEATGLDLDGRRDMIRRAMPGIKKVASEFMDLIKKIPGFNRLPRMDQYSILKCSFIEADIMGGYHMYHADHDMWSFPGQRSFSMKEMSVIHNKDRLALFSDAMVAMQMLDLTPEERAVLYAYLVCTADAPLSQEGIRLLSAVQDTLADMIVRLMHKNHDQPYHFFSRIVSALLKVKQGAYGMYFEYGKSVRVFSDLDWPNIALHVFDPQKARGPLHF